MARVVLSAVLLAVALSFVAVPGIAAVTELVSASSTGEVGNAGGGFLAVSDDGRYVAFDSLSSNLVADDTNIVGDIFIRDRLTGSVERVSISSTGEQADDTSGYPDISPDGRYIVFHSDATNLVSEDTNGVIDVFLRDRLTGVTERVSVSSAGVQGNGDSSRASVSANGRYVAFQSLATNFGSNDTNDDMDIFVRDRTAGTTWRISNTPGGQAGGDWSSLPYISDDASCVVFQSSASDLVSDDTNGRMDVFVCDIPAGNLELASVSSTGGQGNSTSQAGRPSANGRFIAFASWASNLVGGDTNGSFDTFVHDTLTGITERVSVSSKGEQGNGNTYESALSADGRYIAFKSYSTNLVSGDTNGYVDVFVRDRISGTTERASVSTTGEQANGDSQSIEISGDGRCVAFMTIASNLAGVDTNGVEDTILRDRSGGGYAHPQNVSLYADPAGTSPFDIITSWIDHNSFSDIRRCYVLINDSLSQTNAVLLYYDGLSKKVYLKNDANTSWGTGYAPGANVTLSNSQCSLDVKNTGTSGLGDNLQMLWTVALKTPFITKSLKYYMYVQDYAGHTDGWEQMAVVSNAKPEAVSIACSNSPIPMDTWVTLTSYYRDLNTHYDVRKCYLLLNDSLTQSNAMFLWYDKTTNKVYLKNDSNTSWGIGYALGTATVLENSQCLVDVHTTTAEADGNDLALTWSFLLKSGGMAGKNLYSWMYASDSKNENSGYKKVGTHFAPVAPICLSLSPNSGTVPIGAETPFMALYEDPNGWADIYKIYLQLSVTSSQANAVLLMYDAKQNKVFLRNDVNTSWGTGGVPGSATILQNSQCKVNLASFGPPPWSVTGTQLQVSWPIELKPSMAGKRLCERLFVQDNALLNSGWHVFGYVRTE